MALTLGGVFVLAFLAGLLGRTWIRFYALIALGFALLMGLFAWLIVSGPTGDGWDGRALTYGHWINTRLEALIWLSVAVWLFVVPLGAFLGFLWRNGKTSGQRVSD